MHSSAPTALLLPIFAGQAVEVGSWVGRGKASAAALEDRTESPTQQDPQHGRAAWSRPRTSHRNSTEPALAACQGLEWVEDKRSGCAKPRPHVLGRRCPSAAKALTRGPVLGSEYELVQLSEDVHCLVPQG